MQEVIGVNLVKRKVNTKDVTNFINITEVVKIKEKIFNYFDIPYNNINKGNVTHMTAKQIIMAFVHIKLDLSLKDTAYLTFGNCYQNVINSKKRVKDLIDTEWHYRQQFRKICRLMETKPHIVYNKL